MAKAVRVRTGTRPRPGNGQGREGAARGRGGAAKAMGVLPGAVEAWQRRWRHGLGPWLKP